MANRTINQNAMAAAASLFFMTAAGCQSVYDRVLVDYARSPQHILHERLAQAHDAQRLAQKQLERLTAQIEHAPVEDLRPQIERCDSSLWAAEKSVTAVADALAAWNSHESTLAHDMPDDAPDNLLSSLHQANKQMRAALVRLSDTSMPPDERLADRSDDPTLIADADAEDDTDWLAAVADADTQSQWFLNWLDQESSHTDNAPINSEWTRDPR